jgi:hypothetical protein
MTSFNKTFAGGKWDHMMDQSHIGYTTWRDPPENTMAAITLKTITAPEAAGLGVAIDGSPDAWPGAAGPAALPMFDALNQQRSYVDVFNRGRTAFAYTARASAPWVVLSETGGTVEKDRRVWVTVDWTKAPVGAVHATLTIAGAGAEVVIDVPARRPLGVTRESLAGFAEGAGYVSIEPEHVSHTWSLQGAEGGDWRWIRVEGYGRTLSGMRAEGPVDAEPLTPPGAKVSLEYQMYIVTPGVLHVTSMLAPTLNFVPGRPLRFAVSVDDEPPQIIPVVPAAYTAAGRDWEESVMNNARTITTTHPSVTTGYHTLKIWMVDPAVVVQKIVVATGGTTLPSSYLGPPESFHAHLFEPRPAP